MRFLLNGSDFEIEAFSVSGADISKKLGVENEAVALRVNGVLKDLTATIKDGDSVEVIMANSHDGLDVIRHSCAHLMAYAVKELYGDVKVAIGPVIENGFYYDFDMDRTISTTDLDFIEKKMHELLERDYVVERSVITKENAIRMFERDGEKYKVELVNSIPDDQEVTLYKEGDFTDLCRGPHVPSTGKISKYFKLIKVAGVYWRGDSKNKMLQRIYAVCFNTKDELENHLKMLEEAEKRDHRKLGKQLDLFHLQEEAVGSVFWHPRGFTLYRILENYIRGKLLRNGYQEVRTPQLMSRSIWETSGHWEKFRENMFVVQDEGNDKVLAIKPMNCPAHILIYKTNLYSYRQLPVRYSEFGVCHRNETSGSMHGIMRLRAFIQDDGHIICAREQINQETISFCNLLKEVYKELGFNKIKIKYSDRPAVRAGSDEVWDIAEDALLNAAQNAGLELIQNKGEGAFYGPKLEFVLQDAIGRDWQCGTFQVDFILPERFGIEYVGEDGKKHTPVLLHRAILGSMERFIGILLENYSGNLPLWLAPDQIVISTITDECNDYANEVNEKFLDAGIRSKLDLRNEKISYKIRESSVAKIPLIGVVGMKERDNNTIAIRTLGSEEQKVITIDDAIALIKAGN